MAACNGDDAPTHDAATDDAATHDAPTDDAAICASGTCAAQPLDDNPYCGAECQRLEQLSQGCLGSHTEQDCVACGSTYIRVGGDDAHWLFFDATGELVTVQIIGEGSTCDDAWFGIDLSECTLNGEVERVSCDPQPS